MPKKISNGLVTLSSAAILAVYAAGYERTAPAAERFAAQLAQRRTPALVQQKILESPMRAAIQARENVSPGQPDQAAPSQRGGKGPASAPAPADKKAGREVPAAASEPAVEGAAAPARVDATSNPDAVRPASPDPQYKDGVYLGWGYSRHGNIQAFVRIEGGRIIHAGIERCETRWSCDFVAHLPGQVVQRQSAEVDFVTGATQSGDAFYGGIVAALAQAK